MDGAPVGLVSLRDTVRPESRAVLDALRAEGHTVAMVGDAPTTRPRWPARTSASRWAPAGPTWRWTADVALAGDNLANLLALRDLGRRTIGLVRQNHGLSIAANAAGLAVSAAGALSPVVARRPAQRVLGGRGRQQLPADPAPGAPGARWRGQPAAFVR